MLHRHQTRPLLFPHAVEAMTTLNRGASKAALSAGIKAVTGVTGFGLLGHLLTMARASNVTGVINAAAVPCLDGAREAQRRGFVSGATRRNLDWVRLHPAAAKDELLLLADAQTSGGLLVAGEIPGAPVIGELIPRIDRSSCVDIDCERSRAVEPAHDCGTCR